MAKSDADPTTARERPPATPPRPPARFWTLLAAARAPATIAILISLLYLTPGLSNELLRIYAEDFALSEGLTPANLRLLGVLAALWLLGHLLSADALRAAARIGDGSRRAFWALAWIGAAPALSAAIATYFAAARMATAELPAIFEVPTATTLLGLTAALLAMGIWRLALFWWATARQGDAPRRGPAPPLWAAQALALAATAALAVQGAVAAPAVGALAIVTIFAATALAGAVWLFERSKIAVIGPLALAALVFSVNDLNDNQGLRALDVPASTRAAPTSPDRNAIADAFAAWLAARPDRDLYAERGARYPVYIIAARGGALEAAHQTAIFLARIQDACPRFASHIFAISGVSGGAFGATLFTALADASGPPPPSGADDLCAPAPTTRETGDFEAAVRAVHRADLFSPLVSAALFRELPAHFAPIPLPQTSRAVAFETALERAVAATRLAEAAGPGAGLQSGLFSYWRPDGVAPALLLSATVVETGRALVFAPFRDLGAALRSYAAAAAPTPSGGAPDLRLSTAAVAALRAPGLMKPASVILAEADRAVPADAPRLVKHRLADGVFVDGSGIDAAVQVIDGVRASLRNERRSRAREARRSGESVERSAQPDVDLRLIILADRSGEATWGPTNGLALPQYAALLTNTYRRQREQAERRARLQLFADCEALLIPGEIPPPNISVDRLCPMSAYAQTRVWTVATTADAFGGGLGWSLSRATLSEIERQLGTADACPAAASGAALELGAESEDAAPDPAAFDELARHNGCVAWLILRQLRGRL